MSQRPTLYISGFGLNLHAFPNPRRVLATINALGLNRHIDIKFIPQPELSTNLELIKHNPQAKVPVFVDLDGVAYTESNDIMKILCGYADGQTLYPTELAEEIERWQEFGDRLNNEVLKTVLYETVFAPMRGGQTDRDAVAKAISDFHPMAQELNNHLESNNGFAAGQNLTPADYALANPESYWFNPFKPGQNEPMLAGIEALQWTEYPHIVKFYERMSQEPSWANTTPQQAMNLAAGKPVGGDAPTDPRDGP